MGSYIPYDILHELESIDENKEPQKYNAVLHKLHKKMGIQEDEESKEAREAELKSNIIKLNNYGYTKKDICIKLKLRDGKQYTQLMKFYKKHNLKTKPKFHYKVDDVYIQTLNTIRYWGFSCDNNYNIALKRCKNRGITIVKQDYFWGDLPKNAKYILKKDINTVLVK